MAKRIGGLFYDVKLKTSDFEKSLKKLQRNLDAMTKDVEKLGKSITKKLTMPIIAIGAAATVAFSRQEKAEKRLMSTIRAHGLEVDKVFGKYKNLAEQISKYTTFSDETVLSNMQYAMSLGVTAKQMEFVQRGAIGLSVAQGKDLQATTDALAKAMQGNFKALTAYIPALKGVTDQSQRMAIVNAALNQSWQFATDETETLEGKIKVLTGRVVDFGERIGKLLMPIVDLLMARVGKIIGYFEQMEDGLLRQSILIGGVVAAMGPLLIVGAKLVSTLSLAVSGLRLLTSGLAVSPLGWFLAIAAAVAFATTMVLKFTKAGESISSAFRDNPLVKIAQEFGEGLITSIENALIYAYGHVSNFIDSVGSWIDDFSGKSTSWLAENLEEIDQFFRDLGNGILTFCETRLVRTITAFFLKISGLIIKVGASLLSILAKTFSIIISGFGAAFYALGKKLQSVVLYVKTGLINGVKSFGEGLVNSGIGAINKIISYWNKLAPSMFQTSFSIDERDFGRTNYGESNTDFGADFSNAYSIGRQNTDFSDNFKGFGDMASDILGEIAGKILPKDHEDAIESQVEATKTQIEATNKLTSKFEPLQMSVSGLTKQLGGVKYSDEAMKKAQEVVEGKVSTNKATKLEAEAILRGDSIEGKSTRFAKYAEDPMASKDKDRQERSRAEYSSFLGEEDSRDSRRGGDVNAIDNTKEQERMRARMGGSKSAATSQISEAKGNAQNAPDGKKSEKSGADDSKTGAAVDKLTAKLEQIFVPTGAQA